MREKRKGKVPKTIGWALVLAVFVTGLLVLYTGRIRFLCILSGSMEPALPAGGLICIRSCEPRSLGPGDVITYVMSDGTTKVTHRIQEKADREGWFITRGDANQGVDAAPVSPDRILGKLCFCIPAFGWMAIHPVLAVLFLACPFFAVWLLTAVRRESAITFALAAGLLLAGADPVNAMTGGRSGILKNDFTPGSVQVELEEPGFVPDSPVRPGGSVPKDPQVKNMGSHDVIAFVSVTVPAPVISCVADGRKTQPARTQLFTLPSDPSWELIGRKEETDCIRLTYGYTRVLSPGQVSLPVFTSMTAADYLEGSLTQGEQIRIPVLAEAVQKEMLPEELRPDGVIRDGLAGLYQEVFGQGP